MQKYKSIKIIPLGGLGEIGKNITAFQYDDEIIVVDCGLAFPDEDLYGIDLVIPDITFLKRNKDKVKGIFITHGHEDHIGALPYILKELNVPVYGTRLTLGLIETKLTEHKMLNDCTLNVVEQGETVKLNNFKIEFIRTNHSIADSCALALHTPIGVIIHTGDIKVDYTPIDGKVIDLGRFAELGKKGVLLLMADSTNVTHPGHTMSESAFSGRSMEKISEVAIKLGYLNIPEGMLVGLDEVKNYANDRITIVTTGSQGEPMSALTRIAAGNHRSIQVEKGDMVIISATPIPGNEKSVSNIINELSKRGADVIYSSMEAIHVSGHACEDELKLIHALVKPKFFLPVHGEYKHLKKHAQLSEIMGVRPNNIAILENGDVFELTRRWGKVVGKVPSGRILIDGSGVGDVGNIVLRDRKSLSQDGIITVVVAINKESKSITSGPDIITRGFVYVRDSEELMKELRNIATDSVEKCLDNDITEWAEIKKNIRTDINSYVYEKIKRRPMVV
ncbi:MAG: ribonuclease J, partial [Clostridium sp.]|nr:ribonuclease J [Clostridium sp.]